MLLLASWLTQPTRPSWGPHLTWKLWIAHGRGLEDAWESTLQVWNNFRGDSRDWDTALTGT